MQDNLKIEMQKKNQSSNLLNNYQIKKTSLNMKENKSKVNLNTFEYFLTNGNRPTNNINNNYRKPNINNNDNKNNKII